MTIALAVLLVLAIVKPWGSDDDSGSSGGRQSFGVAQPQSNEPAATADTSAEGLAEGICLGSGAWQIVSTQGWRTQDVRVWRVIEPLTTATGPADPGIPAVPVAAFQIRDLGWCAPVSGPGRPIGPVTVTSWRLERDRPVFVRLRQVAPAAGETRFGALYAPPQACDPGCPVSPSPLPTLDGLASWLTGRYIFRYADAGNGSTAWFAADVEVVPPLIEPLPAESP